MSGLNDGGIDLPYESHPETVINVDDGAVCAGVVIMAAKLEVDGEPRPTLIFRFTDAFTGEFLRPVVLISDPQRLQDLVDLVTKASADAVKPSTT